VSFFTIGVLGWVVIRELAPLLVGDVCVVSFYPVLLKVVEEVEADGDG
jgi:hypothetical protein